MRWALAVVCLASCTQAFEPATTELGMVPVDHPALERPAPRRARRLSHLQLRRSLEAVLGTPWVEDGRDLLLELAPTLGDPDYHEITTENLDASPLYVKFMEDLAASVCAAAPLSRLAPTGRRDDDVRALKLALHGELVPPGQPGLEPLLALHDAGGIRAVCVALLAAPEFFFY
jgi:hypothetical protein